MMKRPSCNTSSPLAALALLLLLLLVCFFHCAAAARLLPAVPPLVHQGWCCRWPSASGRRRGQWRRAFSLGGENRRR
ncbi:hypothetical protein SEVIR_8G027000v4 [Setaria viridis]